jgi:hypothetical protein
MKKLPIKLQRIIKKKSFSLNTQDSTRRWRGGLKIDYRITMVKAEHEDNYQYLSPTTSEYNDIHVNLKVKGMVETRKNYSEEKLWDEISKATKTRKNYWGGYDCSYDSLWGTQLNKSVRTEIRSKVKEKITNYLKLMGITTKRWDGGIKIKVINWEK